MVILGLSGSLRAGSWNSALLHAAGGLLPPSARIKTYAGLAQVPPYSEDTDNELAPTHVAHLRAAIGEADAILIATPEYNGSFPGQLKNALDWASRPYPHNVLQHKPAAVIGASTGLFGAIWAQAATAKVLTTAGANVIDAELAVGTAPEAFDHELRLRDPDQNLTLRRLLATLVAEAHSTVPIPA